MPEEEPSQLEPHNHHDLDNNPTYSERALWWASTYSFVLGALSTELWLGGRVDISKYLFYSSQIALVFGFVSTSINIDLMNRVDFKRDVTEAWIMMAREVYLQSAIMLGANLILLSGLQDKLSL